MTSPLFIKPPGVLLYLPKQMQGYFIRPEDIPSYAEQGHYSAGLVLLSYVIVTIAAYVALSIAGKLTGSDDKSQRLKVICGALAMGAGIWAMHFIGMLAYKMRMLVNYDPWITAISMLVAVGFAGAAFSVLRTENLNNRLVLTAAPLLGFAVCGMHYIGMQAMEMGAKLVYRPDLYLLSFVIATGASAAALKMMFHTRGARHPAAYRLFAAMTMGIAVCGMHYTGMAASVFLPYADCRYVPDQNFSGLTTSVALITLLIVFVAYLVRQLDDALAEAQQRTAQLFQAQKMEAVGQLTGGIAHDFNNIMGAVIGSLELLGQMAALPPRAGMLVQNGLDSARKASELTQRLLAFSRKQALEPVPTDLTALIPSAMTLAERATGASVTLKAELPERLPPVCIDPVHLESALLNLVLNAKDAMPEGGTVTIAAKTQKLSAAQARKLNVEAGEYVVVTVRDTGTGMSPDVMAQAMEPLFTTKELGKGSGMGLSMVLGFARQSGGTVTLDSKLRQGTTVSIYIPCLKE